MSVGVKSRLSFCRVGDGNGECACVVLGNLNGEFCR